MILIVRDLLFSALSVKTQTTRSTRVVVMPPTSFDSLVARVRGEYCEMPGLRLTVSQACRLWHADVSTCEMLFEQ